MDSPVQWLSLGNSKHSLHRSRGLFGQGFSPLTCPLGANALSDGLLPGGPPVCQTGMKLADWDF